MSTAFGMPSEDLEIEGMDDLLDEPEETPVEEPEVEEVPAEEPQVEEPEEVEEPEVPEAEGEAEAEYVEFAGRRFSTLDEAARSYHEMQGLQSRTAEQMRQQQQQLETERAQMVAFLQQVEPVLRQAQQPQQQQAPKVLSPGDMDFDAENPEHVSAWVNSQVETRVQQAMAQQQQALDARYAPMQQALAAQQQQAVQQRVEQDMAVYSSEIDSFRSEHPEVAVGSTTEQALAGVLQPLRSINVMPSKPMLEMGLDATRSPQLYREVEAERLRVEGVALANPQVSPSQIPSLFDTGEGIATLYQRAGLAPQGTQTTARVRTERPHVETGGSGAPVTTAPGAVPDDLDRAFAKHQQDQENASPLFGGGIRL